MAAPRAAITLGTRGSPLALRQSEIVRDLLIARFPTLAVRVQTVQTMGDRIQDRPIWQIGDKGVFVRAIERALLAGEIDIAVHSLKDVPSDVETPGLALSGFSPREDARDVLVSGGKDTLAALPAGSRVGTSSLRRRVQVLAIRPDLSVQDIRGNVDTRLRKLDEGQYEAILLAAAGLLRLGRGERIAERLPADTFVPDAGQGIIALQTRLEGEGREIALAVDDPDSHAAADAERAVVRALGADCHSPVGAYAEVQNGRMLLRAVAAREDGSNLVRIEEEGEVGAGVEVGRDVGVRLRRLIEEGGQKDR
ncbi:MAG: hydroxymethylbilane synthase [Chloroflexi bacterium]|nr:hydroxymethylbilane synthase [Chloroflexota bacterium]